MSKIIITDIPEELYHSVKERARRAKRSLSREVIACLESALGNKKQNACKIIARARALRRGISARLTDETLQALKSKGRP